MIRQAQPDSPTPAAPGGSADGVTVRTTCNIATGSKRPRS